MNIHRTTDTTEQTKSVSPDAPENSSTPETPDVADAPVKSATLCPSCNYSEQSEFLICPRCGLVIEKYFLRAQQTDAPQSSTAGKADAVSSMPNATVIQSSSRVLTAICLVAAVVLGVTLYKGKTHSPVSASSTTDASGRTEASSPAAPTSPTLATNASSANPTTETVSTNPGNSGNVMPYTLPNRLGITVKKIIFASDVDASNMPVDNLTRIPFNGRKIVVRVKMEIPPEKTYQFTGKFFDGDGKLVMNVTSPTTPTLSVWYAWYYHYLDRTDDKPGNWKFAFFVNGEQILEKQVEVVDQ